MGNRGAPELTTLGRTPAQYVALGSSFAAGIGLGPRAPASPRLCMRSCNGYPRQLARQRGLSLVDMTCSGATATHVLQGGQMFLGPQIEALTPATELVTLTAGGNDIRYVGDLALMSAAAMPTLPGWAIRRFWAGPLPPERRDYAAVQARLAAILQEIRRRAPQAHIVVVTYPAILPPNGSCPDLGLDATQVASMRAIGERLAEATRSAAAESGASLVNMHRLGAAHHACSAEPWVNGWLNSSGTRYHPTLAGATATAQAIATLLDRQACGQTDGQP